MHSIYYNGNLSSKISLSEEESFHCAKVLRLRPGSEVLIFNGKDSFGKGEIVSSNIKETIISLININPIIKRPFTIHMAVAPTKNADRYEWMVEKCIEMGVESISPIICENSERSNIKTERLHRIAIAAMKQSRNYLMPEINDPILFKDWLTTENSEKKLIAHCYNEERHDLVKSIENSTSIAVAIGPEGDFSLKEIKMAFNNSFAPIHLGTSRLRTETAGLYVCATINSLFNSK